VIYGFGACLSIFVILNYSMVEALNYRYYKVIIYETYVVSIIVEGMPSLLYAVTNIPYDED